MVDCFRKIIKNEGYIGAHCTSRLRQDFHFAVPPDCTVVLLHLFVWRRQRGSYIHSPTHAQVLKHTGLPSSPPTTPGAPFTVTSSVNKR